MPKASPGDGDPHDTSVRCSSASGSFDIRLVPLAVQTADPNDGVALSGTASGVVKNTLVVVIPNGNAAVNSGTVAWSLSRLGLP
jgi:hypothetical protein